MTHAAPQLAAGRIFDGGEKGPVNCAEVFTRFTRRVCLSTRVERTAASPVVVASIVARKPPKRECYDNRDRIS